MERRNDSAATRMKTMTKLIDTLLILQMNASEMGKRGYIRWEGKKLLEIEYRDFGGWKRRANKTKVYCRCGVRFVMAVAARIEGDGWRFEGVYEALCVTRWKNDPPP